MSTRKIQNNKVGGVIVPGTNLQKAPLGRIQKALSAGKNDKKWMKLTAEEKTEEIKERVAVEYKKKRLTDLEAKNVMKIFDAVDRGAVQKMTWFQIEKKLADTSLDIPDRPSPLPPLEEEEGEPEREGELLPWERRPKIPEPPSPSDFEKALDDPLPPSPSDFEKALDDPLPPSPPDLEAPLVSVDDDDADDDDDDDTLPDYWHQSIPPRVQAQFIDDDIAPDEMVHIPENFVGAQETMVPPPDRPNLPIHPMQTPRLEDFIKISGMPMEINLQDFLNGIMNRKEQETGIIDNKDPTDVVDANIVYTRFNPMPSRKQIKKRVSLATLNNLRPYLTTVYAKNWKTMPNYISDAVVSQEGFEMIAQFLDAPMSTNALRIDSIWGETTQRGKTTTFTLD